MSQNDDIIRPMHYVDRRGHDLFYEFENGNSPAIEAICFCYLNMMKYERRAGKKTADPTEDLNKARQNYREEDSNGESIDKSPTGGD